LYLFIFEFLGTNELLVILVVALILLGPRKLPQMSRKLGKSIADFKKTSEEFKRTWEKEVELESLDQNAAPTRSILPPQDSPKSTIDRGNLSDTLQASEVIEAETVSNFPSPTVTSIDPSVMKPSPEATSEEPAISAPSRKRDWL
jgi:sec-independent protein translocase protein TatB